LEYRLEFGKNHRDLQQYRRDPSHPHRPFAARDPAALLTSKFGGFLQPGRIHPGCIDGIVRSSSPIYRLIPLYRMMTARQTALREMPTSRPMR
jgi:hypothetical protein